MNKNQKQNQTFVYLAAGCAALGGFIFGYDAGMIAGALIFIKEQFSLSAFAQGELIGSGLIGAAIAALSGGFFSDRFGRQKSLLISALLFLIGVVISVVAPTVNILLFGRLVLGLGLGLASTAAPLYIAEIAPAEIRGFLLFFFQLAVTLGILIGYLSDYGLAGTGQWRWILGSSLVPGLMLGISALFLPETPRWLGRQGAFVKMRQSLAWLRGTEEVDTEFQEIQSSCLKIEEKGTFADLWVPAVRPALFVGIGLAVFQQVTGINTIIYYAPTIIQSVGISSASSALLATTGLGVVNVVMTIVAMWLVDRMGRRPLLLIGLGGMFISLAILGSVFYFNQGNALSSFMAVLSLMAYIAAFAISLGAIVWLMIGEIFPLKVRGIAGGVAAGCLWLSNFIVSSTFTTLVVAFGASSTFWLYAFFAVMAWFFVYYYVPETKGRSLEEIERLWQSKGKGN